MKKITNSIFVLGILSLAFIACSGDSYQKRLDKEKKAVENFLADNKISLIHEYPDDHKFEENEYYLEPGTGVYLRVINPGKLETAIEEGKNEWVTLRFDSVYGMVSDYYAFGNNTEYSNPITFNFNDPNTYYGTNADITDYRYMYMSAALALPLEKGLGRGAEVSMIVPFVNGSSYQKSYYEPYYFPYIIYRWNKQMGDGTTSDSDK